MIDLAVGAVHVWHARLPNEWTPPAGVLSYQEQEKVTRLKRDEVRVLKAFSYSVRREILSRYLSLTPHEIVFGEGEYGKPYIANTELPLSFNVSDTEGVVIVAVSHESVGVDVEPKGRVMGPGLATHILSEEERMHYQTLGPGEASRFLLTVWVAKEAYVKCLGKGLQWEMPSFSVFLGVSESLSGLRLLDCLYEINIGELHESMLCCMSREQMLHPPTVFDYKCVLTCD